MNHAQDYYANFGNLSVEEYVDKYLRSSYQQMYRIRRTVDFFPTDISSVLDVGAGFGILLETLESRRGIRGVGIEITDEKIEYARKRGIDMRKGDASKLDFPDKSFDLVVSCEVLEHLPFGVFEASLSEFIRVSRKYVVISVPFEENRVFIRCPYCGSSINPDYHLRDFNIRTMTNLFPNARLTKTMTIGQIKTIPFHKWLNRHKSITWPPFLVCPCCGYRETNPDTKAIRNERDFESKIKKNFKNKLKEILGVSKPIWILGLYSAESYS